MRLIADTFAPRTDTQPSASDVGAPEISLELAAANPRAAELRQLKAILDLWDTRALGLALTGRPRRFSSLDQAERERVLLSLSDSSVATKRVLYASLKQAALLPYYMVGGRPVWEPMGYPGPLGRRTDAPAAPYETSRATRPTTLDCDVVVVGSGSGGGTAAGVLAAAGLDVVVLEQGDHHDERHFDGGEETGFRSLYALAPQATADGQIMLMAGRGLGGSSVVNYTTSFRTPDHVRREWAGLGVPQFTSDEYDASLDAVCERLGVNTDHDKPGPRDQFLERGADALGWACSAMPRNVRGCDQGVECGRCGMGCRLGAKQSTDRTWLADAAEHGARLYTGITVDRVTVANGRATGVTGVSAEGAPVTVRARAVVAAGGSIHTPALLQRSGLGNPNIGRHLRLHPATAVWGLMEEPVEPWFGSMQSRYVDALTDLEGGYGVLYETAPLTPAFGSGFVSWRGAEPFRASMAELRHSLGVATILRDRDSVGRVRTGRDGHPIVNYRLSPGDSDRLLQGLVGAARLAEAAGARRITSTHHTPVGYEPGVGSLQGFEADLRAAGTDPGRMALAALHLMGSCRMGGSPSSSAVDPDGQTWDVRDLYVADASCFPTASGVNPQISVGAIAHMTASRLAARLT